MKDIVWELFLFGAIAVGLGGWLLIAALLFAFAPLVAVGFVLATAAIVHLFGKMEIGPLW